MQRSFFCIGACVRAFQCCLLVICINDTFLTGRYKGQILTAIGVNCNNQIVPLAFAFVENENLYSWYWFLEWVKVHVVAARPDVCLISDRHAGILQSILKLQRGTATTPPWWGLLSAFYTLQRSSLITLVFSITYNRWYVYTSMLHYD